MVRKDVFLLAYAGTQDEPELYIHCRQVQRKTLHSCMLDVLWTRLVQVAESAAGQETATAATILLVITAAATERKESQLRKKAEKERQEQQVTLQYM